MLPPPLQVCKGQICLFTCSSRANVYLLLEFVPTTDWLTIRTVLHGVFHLYVQVSIEVALFNTMCPLLPAVGVLLLHTMLIRIHSCVHSPLKWWVGVSCIISFMLSSLTHIYNVIFAKQGAFASYGIIIVWVEWISLKTLSSKVLATFVNHHCFLCSLRWALGG